MCVGLNAIGTTKADHTGTAGKSADRQLEAFMTARDGDVNPNANYGFTGIEIRGDSNDESKHNQ